MLLAAVQLGMRKGHAAMEVPRCERVGLPDGNQTWYTQELPAWAVLNDDNGSFLQFNLSSPTDVGFGQAVVDGSQGSSDASTAIAVDEDLPPVALHCIGSSNQAVHVVPSGGGAVAAYLTAIISAYERQLPPVVVFMRGAAQGSKLVDPNIYRVWRGAASFNHDWQLQMFASRPPGSRNVTFMPLSCLEVSLDC